MDTFDNDQLLQYAQCIRSKNNISRISKEMKNYSFEVNSHIMINGLTYHGSLKPKNVFEAVCGSFLESPK